MKEAPFGDKPLHDWSGHAADAIWPKASNTAAEAK
jgi:hypothetical protein